MQKLLVANYSRFVPERSDELQVVTPKAPARRSFGAGGDPPQADNPAR